jgi:hypothetical protein
MTALEESLLLQRELILKYQVCSKRKCIDLVIIQCGVHDTGLWIYRARHETQLNHSTDASQFVSQEIFIFSLKPNTSPASPQASLPVTSLGVIHRIISLKLLACAAVKLSQQEIDSTNDISEEADLETPVIMCDTEAAC